MSKVIATHPDHGKKEFSITVWETILKWENQGGWTRVNAQPQEVAQAQPVEFDPNEAQPQVGKRSKKSKA